MIFSFYSYKGGVGRSMALANVAELFFASGLDVLLVDWDLEAPGLERYFPAAVERALDHPGVIDMLVDYKGRLADPPADDGPDAAPLPDLKDYLLDVYPDHSGPGRLWLLPAGRRRGEQFARYGALVRTFNWEEFYRDWEGELFFDWLRRQLGDLADVVLIDSRTGVSEMSGVCTYQLADAVVMLCAPNEQNLDGTRWMAESFRAPEIVTLRHDRDLPVLVVPARVEDRAETDLYGEFEEEFRRSFGTERFPGTRSLAAPVDELWKLKIPHVPYYAFRETLVVRAQGKRRHADMYEAFLRLRARLALMTPETSKVRVATRRARAAELSGEQRFLPRISNAPLPLPHAFGARVEQLVLIEELLSESEGALQAPAVVGLVGIGGTGKTSLTVAYAGRHGASYAVVWWLRASSEASILADLAALAPRIGLPVDAATSQDDRTAAQKVLEWLEAHRSWLLVFDDVEDPALLQRMLPRGAGHVLFTSSRSGGWADLARVIAVAPVPHDEATAFLMERTGSADAQAAAELASELGGLPLALEQAAAYITGTGIQLSAYLQRLRSQPGALLGRGSPSIMAALKPSIQALEQDNPAAGKLLALLAFLAPDEVPRWLLGDHAELLGRELGGTFGDPLGLDDLVTGLLNYSLVRADGKAITVHRLVQTVMRTALGEAGERLWAGAAVRLLEAAFPEDSRDPAAWPQCERLLPHVLAACDHAQRLSVEGEAAAWLLDRAGTYLQGRGWLREARPLFERALTINVATPAAYPVVAAAHNNLGSILLDLGELDSAREHFEKALALGKQASDGSPLDAIGVRNNLALTLQRMGDLAGARTELEAALETAEAVFGPDHPTVATVVNNLATVLRSLGDLAGARALLERALAITEATLGPDHRAVARLHNNLGSVLTDQGDHEGARRQLERALAIDEAALGPNHPSVALRLCNLSAVVAGLGDVAGGRALLVRALAIDEATLGPDHPDTADIRDRLARLAPSRQR